MITVKDCEAFCDANANWVDELACRECLGMVQAYAQAHQMDVCSRYFARCAESSLSGNVAPPHRH
jgi:hypothetical protein